MKIDNVYNHFIYMFPNWKNDVVAYKKVGSSAICIIFRGGKSRIFLYRSEDDWTFGTKLWRKRPDNIK